MKNRFWLAVTCAIVLGVVALVFAFFSGSLVKSDAEPGLLLLSASAALVFGVFAALFAVVVGDEQGRGSLAKTSNLKVHCIYERVVGGPAGVDGGYLYILRHQDGELRAYRLNKEVPAVFKVVEDKSKPGERLYLEYPEVKPISV